MSMLTLKEGIHQRFRRLREAKRRKMLFLWERLEPGGREPSGIALPVPPDCAPGYLPLFLPSGRASLLCHLPHGARVASRSELPFWAPDTPLRRLFIWKVYPPEQRRWVAQCGSRPSQENRGTQCLRYLWAPMPCGWKAAPTESCGGSHEELGGHLRDIHLGG